MRDGVLGQSHFLCELVTLTAGENLYLGWIHDHANGDIVTVHTHLRSGELKDGRIEVGHDGCAKHHLYGQSVLVVGKRHRDEVREGYARSCRERKRLVAIGVGQPSIGTPGHSLPRAGVCGSANGIDETLPVEFSIGTCARIEVEHRPTGCEEGQRVVEGKGQHLRVDVLRIVGSIDGGRYRSFCSL